MIHKDIFGFDELTGGSAVPDEMVAADDKTLRLAAPWVTQERIDAFVRYQQVQRDGLRGGANIAEAHRAASLASGLEPRVQEPLRAFVTDYCGRRLTVAMLKQKLEQRQRKVAMVEASGGEVSGDDQDVVARLVKEIARLDTLVPLQRRYGEQAVALVGDREGELLALHQEVTRLLQKA